MVAGSKQSAANSDFSKDAVQWKWWAQQPPQPARVPKRAQAEVVSFGILYANPGLMPARAPLARARPPLFSLIGNLLATDLESRCEQTSVRVNERL